MTNVGFGQDSVSAETRHAVFSAHAPGLLGSVLLIRLALRFVDIIDCIPVKEARDKDREDGHASNDAPHLSPYM